LGKIRKIFIIIGLWIQSHDYWIIGHNLPMRILGGLFENFEHDIENSGDISEWDGNAHL
jgi:hypothetical protein